MKIRILIILIIIVMATNAYALSPKVLIEVSQELLDEREELREQIMQNNIRIIYLEASMKHSTTRISLLEQKISLFDKLLQKVTTIEKILEINLQIEQSV